MVGGAGDLRQPGASLVSSKANAGGDVNSGGTYYVSLVTFAVFWSVASAAMLLASARKANRGSAWFWTAMFAASSLVAAYSFSRLLLDGDAT